MSQHIGPRTISAIGGSVKRVGNYRVHTFPSEIVTDGLVLNLDAGDPRSYPSSGTTWTDLSGNGNNGTFGGGTAAPTYNNADGGSLVFDGSDDVVTTNTGILQSSTNEITLEQWIKYDSSNPLNGCVFGYGTTPDSVSNYTFVIHAQSNGFYVFVSNGSSTGGSQSTSGSLTNGSWYHLVWILSPTNIKVYNNGSLVSTASVGFTSLNIKDTFYAAIGRDVRYSTGTSARHFKGNVSITRMYNRALSAAEVAQNYDALRVRYGSYTSTFTPICAGGEGKVEVLCVAGGGGGGGYRGGGGGGAGGLIYNSAFSVDSNSSVSLSVGKGGQGGGGDSISRGQNGNNSTFDTLTAIGGGGGGTTGFPGSNGGSGGGARHNTSQEPTSGVTGQGNSGGRGYATSNSGSGGGGAGQPGEDNVAESSGGGDGGDGLAYSITGTSTYYAGGGGGGGSETGVINPGGLGGGGTGRPNQASGDNGTPNTGGGGGGGGISPYVGGNGANGTVIVRYPATDYNVEVLVVGGGGGGGYCKVGDGGGGGGGAGGLIYNSAFPVSSGKKLQVTVGSGGAGSTTTDGTVNGSNGSNSIFSSLIAIGGGGGGSTRDSRVLSVGGSGGGAGSDLGDNTGGFGTIDQGNNGGSNSTGITGAGGGGAGEVGVSASDGTEVPDGGDGLAYSITGTSTYYAGGGGGGKFSNGTNAAGSGGLGGGGNGGKGVVGSNGTVNTGGGGGGGGMESGVTGKAGGNGGSGIVIIAYKGPQRGIGGTVDTASRPGYTLHKFTTTGTDFFIP